MKDRPKHHVRFLVQRPEFHLLVRASQRSNLPKRIRSRVTHGTCPVLLFIRKLGVRFLTKGRAGTLAHTLVFLPKEAHYLGTHKHSSVFQGTPLLFSHTVSKAEVGEMSRKGEDSLCFRELVSTPLQAPGMSGNVTVVLTVEPLHKAEER